jgi:diguanylate cyclase (GGDEF)-like protein
MATKMPNSISEDSPFKAGVRVLPETQVLLAGQDLLTGLSSRAGLEAHFKLAVARARRFGTRFAVGVIVAEVERESPPGQITGHDPLLVEVGRRLRATLRETDVLARLGETRFAFIAEEIDEPGVAAIAGRVAEAMAAVTRPGADRARPAVGMAIGQSGDQTLAALLRVAEDALLDARARGAYPWSDAPTAPAVPGAVARARPPGPPHRARQVVRRLLGWISLAALLLLAALAMPAEWREHWLPTADDLRQAWREVQAFTERVVDEVRRQLPRRWTE